MSAQPGARANSVISTTAKYDGLQPRGGSLATPPSAIGAVRGVNALIALRAHGSAGAAPGGSVFSGGHLLPRCQSSPGARPSAGDTPDRKSTRLNSSHANRSYAVFCL